MNEMTIEGKYLVEHGLDNEKRINRSWLFQCYSISEVERRLSLWEV